MLKREDVAGPVAAKVGKSEPVEALSPATLDMAGRPATQCYVALTPNYMVFICGPEGRDSYSYKRSELSFAGSSYGASGKVYSFNAGAVDIKFAGVESGMERAIAATFPEDTAQQPMMSAPPPPPANPGPMAPQFGGSSGSPGGSPVAAIAIAIGLVLALAVVGYLFLKSSGKKKKETPPAQPAASAPAPPSEGAASEGRVIILDSLGNEFISIKKKSSGKYKIKVGSVEYKGKVKDNKVKITDSSDSAVIKVKVKDYGFKVYDGADNTIIKAKLDGGGYKIKNDEATLARVKRKGRGYKVVGENGAEIGTAEGYGKSWKAVAPDGSVLFTVEGVDGRTAGALIYLKDNKLAQAGALFYAQVF